MNAAPDGFLLIQGNAGSGRSWARVAAELRAASPGAEIAMPDLPGFGTSSSTPPKGDTTAVRRAFADAACAAAPRGPLAIGAYGLGCVVAVDVALRLGPRVARLVLSGPAGLPSGHGRNAWLSRTAPGAAFLRFAGSTFARRRFLGDQLADPASDADAARLLVEDLRASRGFAAMSHLHGPDAFAAAAGLACGISVLWGERDGVLPVSCAPALLAALPGAARLVTLPGAAHALHLDRPSAVASALVGSRARSE